MSALLGCFDSRIFVGSLVAFALLTIMLVIVSTYSYDSKKEGYGRYSDANLAPKALGMD